jgi:hypothetical protein
LVRPRNDGINAEQRHLRLTLHRVVSQDLREVIEAGLKRLS